MMWENITTNTTSQDDLKCTNRSWSEKFVLEASRYSYTFLMCNRNVCWNTPLSTRGSISSDRGSSLNHLPYLRRPGTVSRSLQCNMLHARNSTNRVIKNSSHCLPLWQNDDSVLLGSGMECCFCLNFLSDSTLHISSFSLILECGIWFKFETAPHPWNTFNTLFKSHVI